MKILERGTPPAELQHQAKCTRCSTVIEFSQGEAKRVFDQRDGDYLTIACPVCQHQITKALR